MALKKGGQTYAASLSHTATAVEIIYWSKTFVLAFLALHTTVFNLIPCQNKILN